MRLLILAQAYPSKKHKSNAFAFIHPRAAYYAKSGAQVDVLNFAAPEEYSEDNVKVITKKTAKNNLRKQQYDIVLSHAPNIRHHARFILANFNYIKNIIFFFHGQEILRVNKYYAKPYKHQAELKLKRLIKLFFDPYKILFFKNFFKILKLLEINYKFVFVSEYLKHLFAKEFRFSLSEIDPISYVIHNPAAEQFLSSTYSFNEYKGDFVTLRPLNRSEFRMDLLSKIAADHPQFKFDIYGAGDFFDRNQKPTNITVHSNFLLQPDIPKILNQYKYGIMLSHHDSQGVMACEMASYGMKLVTSATPAAKEMFSNFHNVKLVDNSKKISLDEIIKDWNATPKNSDKFSMKNTAHKELELIKNIIRN